MVRTAVRYALVFTLIILLNPASFAQDADPISERSILDGLRISGEWFVGYYRSLNNDETNEFAIKRGYLTTSKKFDKHLSARLTQDISVDHEGDGIGSIELRIKYAYAKYTFNDFSILTKPSVEFGVVHRPWLSFEQKINDYRSQGKMYFERIGIISSADYGLYFESLLGGEMSEEYKREVSKNYAGRYGSFGIGVYNGGGYNKLEYNAYKNIEARFSYRPLPDVVPGLQVTYIGAFGRGNTVEAPDYTINSGFLSYECSRTVFTATYYSGVGAQDGDEVDINGNSVDQSGYSIFAELKFPEISASLIGRYDYFKQDYSPVKKEYKGYFFGAAYHFLKGSKIIFTYDSVEKIQGNSNTEGILETTLELRF